MGPENARREHESNLRRVGAQGKTFQRAVATIRNVGTVRVTARCPASLPRTPATTSSTTLSSIFSPPQRTLLAVIHLEQWADDLDLSGAQGNDGEPSRKQIRVGLKIVTVSTTTTILPLVSVLLWYTRCSIRHRCRQLAVGHRRVVGTLDFEFLAFAPSRPVVSEILATQLVGAGKSFQRAKHKYPDHRLVGHCPLSPPGGNRSSSRLDCGHFQDSDASCSFTYGLWLPKSGSVSHFWVFWGRTATIGDS
ncbi:hypothetical protein K474DRAFT_1463148 [Panus rudis PR-1116 ss-1]|nr:hypothetical protein K474DRAFT_1463148 [Panus rudis PR-1116 ss-1]